MHPHGTRFATAGSDHKVKVWNLLPVLDVKHELSGDTPKLLATLADHFGPVNVARFSHNGRFLASGAGMGSCRSCITGDARRAAAVRCTASLVRRALSCCLPVPSCVRCNTWHVCDKTLPYEAAMPSCAGSDDKSVCLYELRAGTGAKSFGSSDGRNVENWKHTSTLRGHLENVLDVAWSVDDRFIASSSVDNQVRRNSV